MPYCNPVFSFHFEIRSFCIIDIIEDRDREMGEKLRVAIVGGGVGGLSALWVSLITFTVPSNWRVTDRVYTGFTQLLPK